MIILRRIRSLLIIICMFFCILPVSAAPVKAETMAGRIVVNGNTFEYYDLDVLLAHIEDWRDKTFAVHMDCDWSGGRLVIPKDANVSFYMHGHVFDRNLSDDKYDGEAIQMNDNCSLTIYGSTLSYEANTDHEISVYHRSDSSGKRDKTETFYGGVITGGYSCDGGGGINMKSNCTLTLHDVTIAGNRAEQFLLSDGYGGGIWVHGGISKAGKIIMYNSTITGNYAYNNGGGIHQSNHNNFLLEMHNSHIDRNYCGDNGAGISLDGEVLMIKGDGKSTVSYNSNGGHDGEKGGGIYIWNDEVTVTGLEIRGNHSGKGGGIYSMEETITISNCVIEDNEAVTSGGGIFVENDVTTITNCTIRNNKSKEGGGVYVDELVDTGFYVTGKTVIKNNQGGNLYLGDDSNVNFELTSGSDVHMNCWASEHTYRRLTEGSVKSSNCIQYLHSDDPGFYFTFDSSPSKRKIYYVGVKYYDNDVGERYEPISATAVSAAEADEAARTPVEGETVTGNHDSGQREYNLYRAYFRAPSFNEEQRDIDSVFYYSDGFFDRDPAEYSDHLATLSASASMAGMYLATEEYPYKHAGARQFLADIGVEENKIYVNDYNIRKPGTDSMGVAIGSKELTDKDGNGTGKILVPILVRGGGYEAEWASNVLVGEWDERSGESVGFSMAADIVMREIESYIIRCGLQDEIEAGNVKFWVSGFSRGGATTNLTAKRLVEKYAFSDSAGQNNEVFAYCIEAPMGGSDEAESLTDKTKYYGIHNVINYADIVPLVAPLSFGVKRYGVDHYIPGTDAGNVTPHTDIIYSAGREDPESEVRVTTYADNEPVYTKKDGKDNPEYISLRNEMEQHLNSIESTFVFDDYFHLMELYLLPPRTGIEEQGSYSVTEEAFIRAFIKDFVDWTVDYRYNYASKVVSLAGTNYVPFQQAARETCALVFSMSPEELDGFITRAMSMTNNISVISLSEKSLFDIWNDVVNGWNTQSEKEKRSWLTFFWRRLKDTGALDYLPEKDVGRLEKNLPTILYYLFYFIFKDNKSSFDTCGVFDTLIRTGTMAANATRIILNHYPEVDLAWFRTQDGYYNGEIFDERNKEYYVEGYESLSRVKAYVTVPSEDEGEDELIEVTPRSENNVFSGNQNITLDIEETKGEAIYYTLENLDTGETLENQLYQGGIGLLHDPERMSTTYRLTVNGRARATDNTEQFFIIKLAGENHTVRFYALKDGDSGIEDVEETYAYRAGEDVCIAAEVPSDKFFMGWNIRDDQGREAGDLLISDPDMLSGPVLRFTMPEPDTDGFSADYELNFSAIYGDKISVLNLSPRLINGTEGGLPEAGQPLAHHLHGEWNGDMGGEGEFGYLYWYYMDEDRKILVPENDTAYNHSAYILEVRIPQKEDMLFGENVEIHIDGVPDENITAVRNPADGSIRLSVVFDETGDAGEEFEPAQADVTKFTLEPWDINIDAPAGEPDVFWISRPQEINIYPLSVEDEVFDDWETEQYEGVEWRARSKQYATLVIREDAPDEVYIRLNYIPVVKKIEFEIGDDTDWVPKAEEAAVNEISHVYFTVTDRYEVARTYDGRNVFGLVWSPLPKWNKTQQPYYRMYDYNKVYTAEFSYQPDGGKNAVIINTETGEEFEISSEFIYSEDLEVYVNGQKAAFDKVYEKAYFTFPKTESDKRTLVLIDQPLDITDISYGADEDDIWGMLWQTTMVETENYSTAEVEISWNSLERVSGDDEFGSASVWMAHGEIVLPDDIANDNNIDISVTQMVYVDAAQIAVAPDASPESGAYLEDISVFLSTMTEDGEIHYTTDGTEATADSPVYSDEEPIVITRDMAAEQEDGKFVIRAVTTREDMFTSTEAVYIYEFTNEIEVPKGNTLVYNMNEQIGQYADTYFTLTADPDSGVTFDEEGNALVKNVGTYEVTAKIADGYQWKVLQTVTETETAYELVEENGELVEKEVERTVEKAEEITTTEDQKITIVVEKASLEDALAEAGSRSYTGQPLTPEVTVMLDETVVPAEEYTVTYSNNTEIGTASFTVTANDINFTGEVSGEFEIKDPADLMPEFSGHQLVLSGTLGLRFGITAPEDFDYTGSYMTFMVSGQEQRADIEEAEDISGMKVFACYLNTLQMAEEIEAVFHFEDGRTIEQTYTLSDYFSYFDDNEAEYDEKTLTLVHAVADYGYYAYPYLVSLHQLEGKYAEITKHYAESYDYDEIRDAVAGYAFTKSFGNSDVTAASYKLALDADTVLSVYLKTAEGTQLEASAEFGGETYEAQDQSGGIYIVRVPGIKASRLGDTVTVNGEAGEEFSVSVSALSYVRSVMNSDKYDEDAKNTVAALYKYYEAVMNFRGND